MNTSPVITVFANSPDQGRGMARDMRVRWALEEVGQPYEVRTVSFADLKQPGHLARNPFGQIPTYEEGGLTLFESGAIVLHIAGKHPGLLQEDTDARARAVGWLFAALSTIEPPIVEREAAGYSERGEPWFEARRAQMEDRIRIRLRELAARLGEADWLDGEFSAGDLMMAEVLKRLEGSGLLTEFPTLLAYLNRAHARPAYARAFAAQLALFRAGAETA